MEKREAFKARLICPVCRASGEAICGEISRPVSGGDKFDRVILAVSEGFRAGGYLDSNQQVVCRRCNGIIPI